MNEFEQHLRDALARRPPPEGFAERVLAEANAERFEPHPRRWAGWAAAAAVVAILTGGLYMDSPRIERARGEEAKQEVLLALRVAGTMLGEVEQRVQRAQPLRIAKPENN